MRISDLEEKVSLLSLIKGKHKVKSIGSGNYRIDPCPICGSKDHFTIYPETNSYSSFSDCCTGGSVYKYLIEVEGMGEDEAYKELLELAGETPEGEFNIKIDNAPNTTEPTKPVEEAITYKDYTNIIIELYNKQTEKQKEYFTNRGISPEIIDKYKLCIGDIKGYGARAIIPTWKDGKVIFYTGRALTKEQEAYRKYDNAEGSAPFFGLDNLKEAKPGDIIFITEGVFDALSLESVGYKAIAMQGIKKEVLKKTIEGYKDITFLTALDNDEAGEKGTREIRQLLGLNSFKIPKQYKDINEWFKNDLGGFKEGIEAQKAPDSLYNYMKDKFIPDIEAYKQFKDRKTGFKNLDKITSLYPGLYVIGGLSTLGKTTFIHQMTDQMAEMGEHILFFSLEMATLELMTKSLARLTAIKDKGYRTNQGLSALQIRLNDIPDHKRGLVQQAITDYEPISKRFNIIEGNFNTDVTAIRSYVDNYISINKVSPIVVIDYLQIIPGRPEDRNDKERIDGVVTELKRISRDYNLSVIVVSSLNRTNYLTPIAFESFKESGGIEYTADVVWGLQLQAIHGEEMHDTKTGIGEKRKIIENAKKANPRQIELVCLKNRNGISNYSCIFEYYPKFDTFEAIEDYAIEFNQGNNRTVI